MALAPLTETCAAQGEDPLLHHLPDYDSLLACDVPEGESPLAEVLRLSTEAKHSFAGGLPDPATFPDPRPLVTTAMERFRPERIMQYGRAGGFLPLCEAAAPWLESLTVEVGKPEDILVTTGSQSALSMVGRILLEQPGELVALESPTYLGAIEAFGERHFKPVIVKSDEDGMDPDSLEDVLSHYNVKFVYSVPDFHNPGGTTIPLARRQPIARTLQRHGALLIEDGPYSQLRYEGEALPTIQSFAPEHVIYMTTLSKLLAPGFRIGFTVAPPRIIERLVRVQGWRTLCPSMFDQGVATIFMERRDGEPSELEKHVPEIIEHYRPRRDAMVRAAEKYFPDDWQWLPPKGGMFLWAWGNPAVTDTLRIFPEALKRGVAYVPGKWFDPEQADGAAMRLNFSLANEKSIDEGMKILGDVLKET